MLLNECEIIRDIYEVERFLGEGAFAEVYRVKHKFLGRQAMKVFKSPCTSQEEIEDKLSEATTLSKIGHPNIIRVFDAGITETHVGQCGYFTMEYVAGGNLMSFWRSHGASFVPIIDSIEILRQICAGLVVAHAEQPPIIHRDIKPPNILIGYDARGLRIRVGDFGLAKRVNPLTLIASASGTPAFKPPESLLNVDSCAGDVWALGVTLYLLLTDRFPDPIHGISDFQKGKCWERPLVPASQYNVQVDSSLDSILFRSLELKSINRYPDAGAMLEALMDWKLPKSVPSKKTGESADEYKSVLGSFTQSSRTTAEKMTKEAMKLSQDVTKLMEAADILEEALNRCPELREKYEYQLKLWRRGILL